MKRRSFAVLFLLTLLCSTTVSAQNEKKVAYGILLDNTGSMRFHLDHVIEVAKELLNRMNQRDSVALFHFETENPAKSDFARIKTGVQATEDKSVAGEYVEDLYIVGGQTTLFDAILSSAEKVGSGAFEGNGIAERVLILVTDGEDRSSKINQKDLIKYLQENRVRVHAVGLTDGLNSQAGFRGGAKTKAENFLKKITKETGGAVIFPKAGENIKVAIGNLLPEKSQ